MHPPHSPGWANFSILMKCTPESGRCHSVCTLWTENPVQVPKSSNLSPLLGHQCDTTQLLTLPPSSRHELALAFVPHPQYSTRGDTVTFLDFFMHVLYSTLLYLPPPLPASTVSEAAGIKPRTVAFSPGCISYVRPGHLIKLFTSGSSLTALFTTTKNHQNIN